MRKMCNIVLGLFISSYGPLGCCGFLGPILKPLLRRTGSYF